jgi:hypothetical protein
MKNYTYHFEVQSLVAQFMAALDDIIIKRYNDQRQEQSKLKVRFVYSPKARVLQDLTDKAQNVQLPVVAVSIAGIARDQARVYNKLDGSFFKKDLNDRKQTGFLPQPLPIDLTLNVDFIAKYDEDFQQIITNFVPYCDPYFVISWRIPELQNYEIRSIVQWSGSINTTYPTELNANTNVRIVGSTSFTVKGWLFKPIEEGTLIYDIKCNFNELKDRYNITNNELLDTVYIHGRPAPSSIIPTHLRIQNSQTVTLFGDMFRRVEAIYLSGGAIQHVQQEYAPFATYKHLSGTYGPFQGFKLDESCYSVDSENKITINLPVEVQKGKLDFIVQNPAGYSSFIANANIHVDEYIYSNIPITQGLVVV